MTHDEQNKLAKQLLAMPIDEWKKLRQLLSATATTAANIKHGQTLWRDSYSAIRTDRARIRDILHSAGFRFYQSGEQVKNVEDFTLKKLTVLPPEDA